MGGFIPKPISVRFIRTAAIVCSVRWRNRTRKVNFKGKADMFTKRTIKKAEVVTSVDTASEALAVSLSEKARVDLDCMAELTGKDVDTVKEELTGIIFQNPLTDQWETADEYLSGNVRFALEIALIVQFFQRTQQTIAAVLIKCSFVGLRVDQTVFLGKSII